RLRHDVLFLVGEFERFLLIGAGRLLFLARLDGFMDAFRAGQDLDLHGQHLLAASLAGSQEPLQFLPANLVQKVLQLLLVLLQIADGLAHVVAGALLVVLGDFLLGLVLLVVGVLDLLLAAGGGRRRIVAALLGVVALAVGLLAALGVAALGLALS